MLIDCRTKDEFNHGHVAGAVNIPLDKITEDRILRRFPDIKKLLSISSAVIISDRKKSESKPLRNWAIKCHLRWKHGRALWNVEKISSFLSQMHLHEIHPNAFATELNQNDSSKNRTQILYHKQKDFSSFECAATVCHFFFDSLYPDNP